MHKLKIQTDEQKNKREKYSPTIVHNLVLLPRALF